MIRLLYSLLCLLLVTSCAQTTIKSVKDSSEAQRTYSKILISIDGNLKNKSLSEDSAIKKLKLHSTSDFYAEYEMFPPLKEYTQKEYTEKLNQEGIEAIVFARMVDRQSKERTGFMPVYNSTYGYVGNKSVNLGATTLQPYQQTINTWVYRISMYDLKNDKIVWVADAETLGKDESIMRYSLISKSINEIIKSGYLPLKK